jgi:hypothetical protein
MTFPVMEAALCCPSPVIFELILSVLKQKGGPKGIDVSKKMHPEMRFQQRNGEEQEVHERFTPVTISALLDDRVGEAMRMMLRQLARFCFCSFC